MLCPVNPLTTARLRLIPASADILDADLSLQVHGIDAALRYLLNVGPIVEWPPTGSDHDINAVEYFRSNVPQGSAGEAWYAYYVCLGKDLLGSAGFFGPPSNDEVEIGYSICEIHRRKGYASEAVGALVDKARNSGVLRVRARTVPDNQASIDLLMKAGFAEREAEDGHRLFVKSL